MQQHCRRVNRLFPTQNQKQHGCQTNCLNPWLVSSSVCLLLLLLTRVLVRRVTERLECVCVCVCVARSSASRRSRRGDAIKALAIPSSQVLFPASARGEGGRGWGGHAPSTSWDSCLSDHSAALWPLGASALHTENGRSLWCVLKLSRMAIIKTVFVYVLTRRGMRKLWIRGVGCV